MVKKFEYRGMPLTELEGLSLENLFKLFNSRQINELGLYTVY